MKKIIHTIILIFLCTAAFSQEPPDFGDPTDGNPTDAPIDNHLSILLLSGILVGIYVIGRKKYKI